MTKELTSREKLMVRGISIQTGIEISILNIVVESGLLCLDKVKPSRRGYTGLPPIERLDDYTIVIGNLVADNDGVYPIREIPSKEREFLKSCRAYGPDVYIGEGTSELLMEYYQVGDYLLHPYKMVTYLCPPHLKRRK